MPKPPAKRKQKAQAESPLFGLEPNDPPRQNKLALAISGSLLAAWIVCLVLLAIQSAA